MCVEIRMILFYANQHDHFDTCSPGQATLFTHPSQRQLLSVCTVVTSLNYTLHHKQNDRLQRHILHHPNNRSCNEWLSHQLALLNAQFTRAKMITHRLCTSEPSTRRSHRLPSIHNEAALARRYCALRRACCHQQPRVSSPRSSRGRSASAGAS